MVRPGDDGVGITVWMRPARLFPDVARRAAGLAGQCLHECGDVGDVLPLAGGADVRDLPEPGPERHRIIRRAIRGIVPEPERHVRAATCGWSNGQKGDGVRTELGVSILEPQGRWKACRHALLHTTPEPAERPGGAATLLHAAPGVDAVDRKGRRRIAVVPQDDW